MSDQMSYEAALGLSKKLLAPEVFRQKGSTKAFDEHRVALHRTGWTLRSLLTEAQQRAARAIEAARRPS